MAKTTTETLMKTAESVIANIGLANIRRQVNCSCQIRHKGSMEDVYMREGNENGRDRVKRRCKVEGMRKRGAWGGRSRMLDTGKSIRSDRRISTCRR